MLHQIGKYVFLFFFPAAKKSKTALLLETINSGDDSDDSDDSDVNLSNMLEDDGEEGEEEESGEEEEDDEDEDDSDDEMEDEDSDEVEEKSPKIEKQLKKTPIKENGIAKKQDKTPKQTPAKDNKQKSPQNEKQKGDKTPKGQKTPGKEGSPLKRTMEGGVVIEELRIGDGQVAKPGKLVQVGIDLTNECYWIIIMIFFRFITKVDSRTITKCLTVRIKAQDLSSV